MVVRPICGLILKGVDTQMKVFISADIEGVAGITHWDEARKGMAEYQEFRSQMTREVVAACEGAREAGATEILIKDAHASGRNLLLDQIPPGVRVVRGWSGHPFCMVQELDSSYDAALFIGYHSRAGAESSPLAHSFSTRIDHLRINDLDCAEFHVHAWAAASVGVPVAFVSGDAGVCADVQQLNPSIAVCPVQEGVGASTISLSQQEAVRRIRRQVTEACSPPL
jgi:D-amino peptidase